MAAADRVGPAGEVVLSDFSAEMVAIAIARVEARGLAHVRGAMRDVEQIDEPEERYDVVLCREGLMYGSRRAARDIQADAGSPGTWKR